MSNQAEIDYEKQFQEDLAKATALSLEQQALDEYNRTKKYGPAYAQTAQQEAKNRQYAQIRRQHYARRESSETIGSTTQYGLTLPLSQSQQQPQRRHSEITHNVPTSTLLTEVERSKTPPAATTSTTAAAENDLINFASPTAKKPESSSFEQLIEDLQKLQATNPQTALMPLGPTAAAPMYHAGYHATTAQAVPGAVATMYAGSAAAVQPPAQYGVTTATGTAGMQLVPFTPPAQQQKVPLTNNELQKLYSMSQPPYTAPVYGGRPMGFMPPAAAGYYPQTPPVVIGAAAPYTAPVQYPNPYGFQYNVVAAPNQQPYYTANMARNSAPLVSSSSYSTAAAAAAAAGHNISSSNQLQSSRNSSDLSSSNSSFTHSKQMPPSSQTAPASSSSLSSAAALSNGQNNLRRQTPPARKLKPTGLDLIDLSHEDDSRVSVLEAFDPLLNENDDVTKRLNN